MISPRRSSTVGQLLAAVPVAFGLLLLLRIAYPGAWPASFGLNLVVVVGASLALGGALAGALVPQALDTMSLLDFTKLDAAGIAALVGNIVLVVGVVCALAYFAFGARANGTRLSPVRRCPWSGGGCSCWPSGPYSARWPPPFTPP